MEEVSSCKKTSRQLISALRGITDFSSISNTLIAQLNNVAYSNINKGGLAKMLDKRAIANKDLYKKFEDETKDLISKMDMSELRDKHSKIIEEVGMCSFSVADSLEALEESDFMCVGLKVNRPEAAIADPSKL